MKTSKLYAPRTGFGRLAGDMIRRYYVHDVARDSAALTYYLLFAIFPLLIFVSTLLGVLELDIASITAVLAPILPSDVVDIIRTYLEYVAANQSRQLLWFSLVFSIWFPMRSTGCLMHSLRKAFGRSAPENILLGQLRTLLFTIWMIFVIGLTLALVVVGAAHCTSCPAFSLCRRRSSASGATCALSFWVLSWPSRWASCTSWRWGSAAPCGRYCPA